VRRRELMKITIEN